MAKIPTLKPGLDRLRLAVSPGEAASISGIGRTTLYEAIGSGALRSLKIGRRRLITVAALEEWLASAEKSGKEASDAR
jgi:excisionase family DNA binding protein